MGRSRRKSRRRSGRGRDVAASTEGKGRPDTGAAATLSAATPRRSAAALVAFLACLWGQSLLLFDWARRTLFDPDDSLHLVLVVPVFAACVAAAAVATWHRFRGRPAAGGSLVHSLGLASGLLGVTALALLTWLGPRVQAREEAGRLEAAVRQLDLLADALELHAEEHGTYPVGEGPVTLREALASLAEPEALRVADPWGNPLVYSSLGAGRGYLLLCTGRDGVQDRPDADYLNPGVGSLTNDLVVVSGRWIAGPSEAAGTQR